MRHQGLSAQAPSAPDLMNFWDVVSCKKVCIILRENIDMMTTEHFFPCCSAVLNHQRQGEMVIQLKAQQEDRPAKQAACAVCATWILLRHACCWDSTISCPCDELFLDKPLSISTPSRWNPVQGCLDEEHNTEGLSSLLSSIMNKYNDPSL